MRADPVHVEALLRRHGQGLRELAAKLLDDPADRDDAVQQVWLGVLRRPPRHAAALGGWFATALRNVARKLQRGEARRARHERTAAERAERHDDSIAFARERIAQRLVAAVGELPEPYRTAIWQRWFEGKAPRDLARLGGEPLATIKSRLQRGLKLLRERLDEFDGDRTDWRAALGIAFAFGRQPAAAPAVATQVIGGVLVATWAKWSAATAAIAFGIWWFVGERAPTEAPPARSAAQDPVFAASAADRAAQPSELAEEREHMAAGRTAIERTAVAAIDGRNAAFTGRCVDERGEPLAGCTVRVRGSPSDDERMERWLVDHLAEPVWTDPTVATGADGRFELSFWPPPPLSFTLEIERDGRCPMSASWWELAEHAAVDVGDVVLQPGVRIAGRVVDADGVLQAGAYVTFAPRVEPSSRGAAADIPRERVQLVRSQTSCSATNGTFASVRLLPGAYTVRAQNRKLVEPEVVELAAGRDIDGLAIVVEPPMSIATIRGRVVDEQGVPVAGAQVGRGAPQWRDVATSRADGGFALRRPADEHDATAELFVTGGGCEPASAAARSVAWGSDDVELHMIRGAALTLRITDGAGAPVERYSVRLMARRSSSSDAWRTRAHGAHADGVAMIPGMTPGDYVLVVDFPRDTGFLSLFETVHQPTNAPRRLDLRAGAGVVRTLRVVAGGEPVAGSRVLLCELFGGSFEDHPFVLPQNLWLRNFGSDPGLVLSDSATDARGEVELRGAAGHTYGVAALGPGHLPEPRARVQLDGEGVLVVDVRRGARLKGRIVPPAAVAELRRLAADAPSEHFPAEHRPRLGLHGAGGAPYPPPRFHMFERIDLALRDDGTFDLAGVPPGTWRVDLSAWQSFGKSSWMTLQHELGTAVLADGETTVCEFDLAPILPGTLDGRVLQNGVPLAGARVMVNGEGAGFTVITDADGRFTQRRPAGLYEVHIEPTGADGPALHWPGRVRIVRGETTTQTFAFASGTLCVTVCDQAGKPLPRVELGLLRPGGDSATLPATDEHGVVRADVDAETITLRVLPKALASPETRASLRAAARARGERDPFATHWLTLATAVIHQGQTTELRVALPVEADYEAGH